MMVRRRHILAAAASALALWVGCGATVGTILREYRLQPPKRQLGQPRWLASFTTDELWGQLSPDGKRLVYAGDQKGSLDIWLKDLSTGLSRRLTTHVTTDTQPRWSPDGRRVVFVSMRHDAKGDIYLYDDGDLQRISGRETADGYPTFSADGKSIYYAAGLGPHSRIVVRRLDDDGGRPRPVTGFGATHPAVSPDGAYLAFTQFDAEGRGRIALRSLSGGKRRLLTAPDYHAGFPAFSADGRSLIFSRFYRGAPARELKQDAIASLWSLPLDRALAARDPAAAQAAARQLTSDRSTALFAQPHPRGIVFTSLRAGSLDLGIIASDGLVPRLATARDQLALARDQDDPWDALLCLQRVWQGRDARLALEARYRASELLRGEGEFAKARAQLDVIADADPAAGDEVWLAKIDLLLLPVEHAVWLAQTSGRQVSASVAQQALARWRAAGEGGADSDRVAAHRLLREGDLLRLAARDQQAIAAYERLLERYPAQREAGAAAKLKLGTLFAKVREPNLLAEYYLTIFDAYPRQRRWLRRGAREVLLLYAKQSPEQQVERFRRLIDANRDKPLFCAMAQRRIGELYEQRKRLDLAIQAMDEVTRRHPKLVREATAAAFELGRLSLAYSAQLRKQGRLGEALQYYARARRAYQRVIKAYEPGHENRQRAHAEYLRLSLLEAGQLERDGERVLAEKRYRELIAFDGEVLQAHRRLIALEIAGGRRAAADKRYRALLDADAGSFVGHYALGYLATFADPPGRQLEEDDLETAEAHLKRAAELRPQSPFAHMTLGWIYEMRERLLGQTRKGWLEEAIELYTRAFELNDRNVDRQTEADLLVNLGGVFANLGNGWAQAYEFCSEREKLRVPFLSKKRALVHELVFGRAATATEHYAQAGKHLERALELSRELELRALEGEALARLALNAHLAGEYASSTGLFRRAKAIFDQAGRQELLAGITRSIAYNQLLAGRRELALGTLREAERLLDKHGTPTIEPFSAIGGVGRSVVPFGFDRADERNAQHALQELLYRRDELWLDARQRLRARLAERKKAQQAREDDELARELVQLEGQLALAELQLGGRDAFYKLLGQAHETLGKLQLDEQGRFAADPDLFALQVGLALNAAEAMHRSLPRAGVARHRQRVAGLQQRLIELERLRAEWVEKEKRPLLAERLRWSLWTDLATLSLWLGLDAERVAAAKAPAQPLAKPLAAQAAVARLLRRGQDLRRAVTLYRRVEQQTRPAAPGTEAVDEVVAAEHGTLSPLFRPVGAVERLRWHVRAGLNLAHAGSALTSAERLADHPTTALLSKLAALCVKHELGALKLVLAAELAWRRQSMQAMRAAVDAFLARSPLLLGRRYRSGAALVRRQIFGRALALALRDKDLEGALAFAEQWDRRTFVDELIALSPAGSGLAAKPVAALLAAGRAYHKALGRQDPTAPEKKREAWFASLQRAQRRVVEAQQQLAQRDPRAASLFEVGAFPVKSLREALAPDDVLITAIVDGPRAQLLAVRHQGPIASQALPSANPTARSLAGPLARLVGSARRVYLELGRLPLALDLQALGLARRPVVRLASCWELVDAAAARTVPQAGGRLVARDGENAAALAKPLGLAPVSVKSEAQLERELEAAGTLVWTAPVRFDSGNVANVRLQLPQRPAAPSPKAPRTKANAKGSSAGAAVALNSDLRLARRLGMPLRGRLLVLTDVRFTPGRRRAQRAALVRLVHAAGIPSLVILEPTARHKGDGSWRELIGALSDSELAVAASSRRLPLYGDGGLPPAGAQARAKQRLAPAIAAGIAALGKRRYGIAIEQLEYALRALRFVGADSDRPKVLKAVAQAYTLREDYGRAVPKMEQLLEYHAAQIAAAKKQGGGRALLMAQAGRVKALMSMGWVRLRYEQYERALTANAEAIALYKAVKRPLLAGPTFAQRSIIAEKKGDMKEALRAAELAFETARQLLARALAKPKTRASAIGLASPRGDLAEAATRVARLQRMRFSNYSQALSKARLAVQQLEWADPARLKQLRVEYGQVSGAKKKASGKAAERLGERLLAIRKEGTLVNGALVARVDTQLELARIFGARGDFGGAVAEGKRALVLAQAAGLASADAAQLEIVNNLYYMGAYGRALDEAETALARTKKNALRQIQFFNVKGTIHAALGHEREALGALGQALRIARKLGRATEIAASHNNIGDALRRAGRFESARESFTEALQIDQTHDDQLGMAFDFANLGLTEMLMGRSALAKRSLARAIELSREIGAPLNELKARVGLGRLELTAKRLDVAQRQFDAGLALARKLGLRNWIWRYRLWSARAQRRRGQTDVARRSLEAALAIVEQQPPRLRPAVGAPKVEAVPDDVYDELIDLLASEHKVTAAFDLLERLRGRSFIDLVSKSAADLPLADGAAELRQLADANVALEGARAALSRARAGSADAKQARQQIATLGEQRAATRAQLEQKAPGRAALLTMDVLAHKKLTPMLRELGDATLLSYYPARERLWIFVLRGERLTVKHVAVDRAQLQQTIEALRGALSRFHPVEPLAGKLYRWLLPEGTLPAAGGRLIVVPAGPLHVLPFAALHDGRDFLVARATLSFLPSVNSLRRARATKQTERGLLPAISLAASAAGPRQLPFTERESDAFTRIFAGAQAFTGQQATHARLVEQAPRAGLLHLATHATFDADAPLRSSFALADRRFELREVFGLSLHAQLVVLSACETGLGPLGGADGILGLHRAFLAVGARRVVSSLFRVSDLGTALLMKHFFRRLAAGEGPARALRAAQQQVRARFAHPAFWAGFRLDGDL